MGERTRPLNPIKSCVFCHCRGGGGAVAAASDAAAGDWGRAIHFTEHQIALDLNNHNTHKYVYA